MNKQIYKNITRFSLPVIVKTVDGSKNTSFNLSPQKTFEILDTQLTGDIKIKTKNRLLQLVSEEPMPESTTEFLKVATPIKVVSKVIETPSKRNREKEKE